MKKELILVAGLSLLAVSLSACGGKPTPDAAPTDLPAPTSEAAAPTAVPVDPCGNLFFPVKNKTVFNYTSSGSPAGVYSFRNVIGNTQAGGFTLTTKYKKLSLPQTWECKPEGMLAGGLGFTDAASSLALEQFTNLTASNITGISLPANLAPGMEWNYSLDLQGAERVKEGQPAGSMTGRTSIAFKAGNTDSVTVPAGTFDAIAIQVTAVNEFQVLSASGETKKVTAHTTYTVWYAPGIGWIKSNGSGNLNGQAYFETIVLESYTIP